MTSTHDCQYQALSLQALAVALQHPAVAVDQRIICTLLQVCKAWRAAVQESAASLTDVKFQKCAVQGKVSTFASFAGWLIKHFQVIRTLQIDDGGYYLASTCSASRQAGRDDLLLATQQILEISMQAAASAASASGTALRLCSYSSDITVTAGLLAALPASTLTHLFLRKTSCNALSALGQLSRLHFLQLYLDSPGAEATDSCLQQIGRLSQLAGLDLYNLSPATGNMRLLPTQLKQLRLEYQDSLHASAAAPGTLVDLQHLTCLQLLRLEAGRLAAGSSLPPNLVSLELLARLPSGGLQGLASLHRVTSIRLGDVGLSSSNLAVYASAIEQLPELRLFANALGKVDGHTLNLAGCWNRLPLRDLCIVTDDAIAADFQQLMPYVAEATMLTELKISIGEILAGGDDEPVVAVCEHLRGLTKLRRLDLCIGDSQNFAVQDAQDLSVLTTLTKLDLAYCGSGPPLDSATLCLLALSLTQLRELSVYVDSGHDEHGRRVVMSALPVIGRLTTLEYLNTECFAKQDAERGLQFLTGLSRLKSLYGFEKAGTAATSAFWACIKAQQQMVEG